MITLHRHTVFAGQFVITSAPSLITTVLGSCVSVCLWDRVTHIGGLNHYLLPGDATDEQHNATRGYAATTVLIQSMLNRKVRLENLEAKVFGGCNSLYTRNDDIFKVGERNIAMALDVLKTFGIPLSASHVGGGYGRKIVFNTDTGKVRMRILNSTTTEINEEINKGFGY